LDREERQGDEKRRKKEGAQGTLRFLTPSTEEWVLRTLFNRWERKKRRAGERGEIAKGEKKRSGKQIVHRTSEGGLAQYSDENKRGRGEGSDQKGKSGGENKIRGQESSMSNGKKHDRLLFLGRRGKTKNPKRERVREEKRKGR